MNDPHDRTPPAEAIDASPVTNGSADSSKAGNDPSDTIEQSDDDATQIASVPCQFDTPGVVVGAFEQLLVAGQQPAIEDFLARLDDTFRLEVFSVLLRKEFESQMQSGERPDLKDMRARFPQYALQIALTHQAVKAEQAGAETNRDSESASEPTSDEETLGEATEIESSQPPSSGTSIAPLASGGGQPAGESMFVDGRYEKQTVLGAGGMGAIWTAFDSRTRRSVAFKEIKTNKVTHQQYVSRFVNEAQITAQLEHPGIVPVHDVGWQPDGSPYYVMRLVSDETLARRIRKFHNLKVGHADRNLESTRLLREFINVCYSLDYAHDRGIIHRDLKPQNVMIGQHGETVIIDWGLAKPFRRNRPVEGQTRSQTPAPGQSTNKAAERVQGESVDLDSYGPDKTPTLVVPDSSNSDTELLDPIEREHATPTIDGAVMGTLDYMAPEQAQGRLDSLDHRADIFALGAILFEILTGEAWPRGRMTTAEKIVYVADGNVPLAREVDENVPRPLEAICRKAVHQDIEDRYGSARELIDDLECWLADKPVSVYADPWTTRCRRWVSRNPKLVTALVVGVTFLAVSYGGMRLTDSRRIATRENDAQQALEFARGCLISGEFSEASLRLSEVLALIREEPELSGRSKSFELEIRQIATLQREAGEIEQLCSTIDRRLQTVDAKLDSLPDLISRGAAEVELVDMSRLAGIRMRSVVSTHELATPLTEEIAARHVDRIRRVKKRIDDALIQATNCNKAFSAIEAFMLAFDSIRLYSLQFPVGTRVEVAGEIQRHAADALRELAVFSFEQPMNSEYGPAPDIGDSEQQQLARQLIADLISNSDRSLLLSKLNAYPKFAQIQRSRLADTLLELCALMADMRLTVAFLGPPGDRESSAASAREWIDIAKPVRFPARSLVQREAVVSKLLDENDESARLQAELEGMPSQFPLDDYLAGQLVRVLPVTGAAERTRHRETAHELFSNAAELNPNHFASQYFAASSAYQIDELAEALDRCSICLAQRPKFPGTLLLRAAVRFKLNDYEQALRDCAEIRKLDSKLFSVWLLQGIVQSELGRDQDALVSFQKAADLRPNAAVALLNRGETLRKIGTSMLQLDGQVMQLPDSETLEPAQAYLNRAHDDLTRVENLGFNETVARARLYRGQLLATQASIAAAQDRTETADEKIKQALDDLRFGIENSGAAEVIAACSFDIGRAQAKVGQFDAALTSFDRALAITPNNPKMLRWKGHAQRKLGQDAEFVASLRRYEELDQPLTEDFWNRGFALHRLGRMREAMQDFTRLLDAEESEYRTEALNRRGWMYLIHAQQFAEQDFDEAIRRQPENPDNYNGRGYARVQRGDYVAAASDAELAVERINVEDAQRGVAVWALYFNAATIYGQAVNRVMNDSDLPGAERTKRRESYTSRAIVLLDLARESADLKLHGRIAQAIKLESSFESIRDTDVFSEMVKRLSAP